MTLLTSFQAVADHLVATGRQTHVDESGERLQHRFADDLVSTMIGMRWLRSRAGLDWLAVSIPICPGQAIHPRAALVASYELPIGSLALYETIIVLRQTLPLPALPIPVFEQTLSTLARTAGLLLLTYSRGSPELPYRYVFR